MKLVSDFDGVLTELKDEAARVREIFYSKLGPLESLTALEAEMRRNPARYGWQEQGRITAFCDEDTFIHTNALAAALDEQANHSPLIQARKQELQSQGIHDFKALGTHAYNQMVNEVMSGSHSPIDPNSKPVLEDLLSRGDQITVVSNSGSKRIQDIFEKAKISHSTFPLSQSKSICVRGGARKFELGPVSSVLSFGERQVDISRPTYRGMILEERPDAVIGDVFSLDLATPYAIALEKPELFPNGLKLILRVRPYTPSWSLNLVTKSLASEKVSVHLLKDLTELPKILHPSAN